jgi:hypothetical protein
MSYFIDGALLCVVVFTAGVLFGAGFYIGNRK